MTGNRPLQMSMELGFDWRRDSVKSTGQKNGAVRMRILTDKRIVAMRRYGITWNMFQPMESKNM